MRSTASAALAAFVCLLAPAPADAGCPGNKLARGKSAGRGGSTAVMLDYRPSASTDVGIATAYLVPAAASESSGAVFGSNVPAPVVRQAPPARRPAREGFIDVSTDVVGATVYLDGRRLGATPLPRAEALPGARRVTVSKYGYRSVQAELIVESGKVAVVEANLAPLR